MPQRTRRLLQLSLFLAAAIVLGSCGDSSPTAPPPPSAQPSPSSSLLGGLIGRSPGEADLIQCPSSETLETSAQLDITGGTVSLGGTRVVLPFGAVLLPTTISLKIPASQYMEIEVTAAQAGQVLDHFIFNRAVLVTIDYSRCGLSLLHQPLSAWNIDVETKELLERMVGFDNRFARSVTFFTGHLSGYALAN